MGFQKLFVCTLSIAGLWSFSAPALEFAPARLIDVGGHRLSIQCAGAGTPVVIMEHGLGGSSDDWRTVQRRLAETSRACIYDRAGYGGSDAGPLPRVSGRIAAELRTLLERAEIPPPYIVAGHSFGGYTARMFAALFPEQTAAVVLLDTPHEGQVDGFFQNQVMQEIDPYGVLGWLWQPQFLSALISVDLAPFAPLLGYSAETLQTILAELAGFKASGEGLRTSDIPEETPLTIIMHGMRVLPDGSLGDEMEREWMRLQQELAARQRHGRVTVASNSAHNIPLHEPELVAREIEQLIKHTRGRSDHSTSAN